MRECGFYWVMINKNVGWLIAHYDDHSRLFGLIGDDEWLCDADMFKINENRILNPEEGETGN